MTANGGGGQQGRPAPLLLVAAVAGLQGLGAAGYGLYLCVRGLVDAPVGGRLGIVLGGLLLVMGGAALLGCARGVLQTRRWARAPIITVQLLTGAVGLGYLGAPPPGLAVGVGLLLLAACVLAAFATPQARLAFFR